MSLGYNRYKLGSYIYNLLKKYPADSQSGNLRVYFYRAGKTTATMNNPIPLKLGKRLSQLVNMIEQRYSIIWDCCCDHGLLGMWLLQKQVADRVVFVDVLSHQMALLDQELQQRFPADNYQWQVLCQDLREVEVPPATPQLFVIAGVGGDKTIEFIHSLGTAAKGQPFDLLVCSVHGNYQVRQTLVEQGFSLLEEQIVFENKRFYEAIYVSSHPGQAIAATGSSMWDWSNSHHHDYINKILVHYRKKAAADPGKYSAVVDQYEELLQSAAPVPEDGPIVKESGR